MSTPEQILSFWLGQLDEQGSASPEHSRRWWKKDPAFDREIRERFQDDYQAITAGERDDWLEDARGRLAYIIVLDQFARNMFRGTPRMFAGDERAQRAVLEGLDRGHDRELAPAERSFFYMPLMHAEDRDLQRRSVELFAQLRDDCTGKQRASYEKSLGFAETHRDIVERFGRFPHRNAILGRDHTDEETQFLDDGGPTF